MKGRSKLLRATQSGVGAFRWARKNCGMLILLTLTSNILRCAAPTQGCRLQGAFIDCALYYFGWGPLLAAAATFFGAEMDAVAAAVRGGHGRHAARGQRAPRGSRGVHVLRLRPRLCRVCPRPSSRKGRRRASRRSTRFRPHLWRGCARCEPLWALALPCAVPGPCIDAGRARGVQKGSFPGRWALFYSARRAVRDEERRSC